MLQSCIFFRLQQQNHSSVVSFHFRLKEIKKNCLLFAYFVFFFICINKLPFKFKTLSLQYVRIIRIIHFYSVTLLCSCISFLLWFFFSFKFLLLHLSLISILLCGRSFLFVCENRWRYKWLWINIKMCFRSLSTIALFNWIVVLKSLLIFFFLKKKMMKEIESRCICWRALWV